MGGDEVQDDQGSGTAEGAGGSGAGPDDGLIDIVLPGLPLQLFERWRERFADLTREFALITLSGSERAVGVPQNLVDLADEVTSTYADAVAAASEARDAAIARGEETMDLVYRLPRSVGAHAARLEEILVEADEYCRSADLLTLAAPLEFIAFRHWYFGNVIRQCAGFRPVLWRGPLA